MIIAVPMVLVHVGPDEFDCGGIESEAVEGDNVRDGSIIVNHGGNGGRDAREVVFYDEVEEAVSEFGNGADREEMFLNPAQGVFWDEKVDQFSTEKYEVGHSFVLEEAADGNIGVPTGVRVDCSPDNWDFVIEDLVF